MKVWSPREKLKAADLNGNFTEVSDTASAALAAANAAYAAVGGVAGNVAASLQTRPQITPGTAQVGVTLHAVAAVFNGTPTPTVQYQWQWADTTPFTNIAGATTLDYTPVLGDVTHTLQLRAIGGNNVGAPVTVYSPASTAVIPANTTLAPQVITGPTISGNPVDGGVLTLNLGVWAGSPAIVYDLQVIYGETGAAVAGAKGPTFTVSASRDAGHTIAWRITGSNGVGTPVTVTTLATAMVLGLPPVNTVAPRLANGQLTVGDTLSIVAGTYTSADPLTRSYRVIRADTNEVLGNAQTYVVTQADAGHFLRGDEIVSNRWDTNNPLVVPTSWSGQVTGTSVPTSPPVLQSPPTISGSLVQGSAITLTPGVYIG